MREGERGRPPTLPKCLESSQSVRARDVVHQLRTYWHGFLWLGYPCASVGLSPLDFRNTAIRQYQKPWGIAARPASNASLAVINQLSLYHEDPIGLRARKEEPARRQILNPLFGISVASEHNKSPCRLRGRTRHLLSHHPQLALAF